jgi:hypothetical protein
MEALLSRGDHSLLSCTEIPASQLNSGKNSVFDLGLMHGKRLSGKLSANEYKQLPWCIHNELKKGRKTVPPDCLIEWTHYCEGVAEGLLAYWIDPVVADTYLDELRSLVMGAGEKTWQKIFDPELSPEERSKLLVVALDCFNRLTDLPLRSSRGHFLDIQPGNLESHSILVDACRGRRRLKIDCYRDFVILFKAPEYDELRERVEELAETTKIALSAEQTSLEQLSQLAAQEGLEQFKIAFQKSGTSSGRWLDPFLPQQDQEYSSQAINRTLSHLLQFVTLFNDTEEIALRHRMANRVFSSLRLFREVKLKDIDQAKETGVAIITLLTSVSEFITPTEPGCKRLRPEAWEGVRHLICFANQAVNDDFLHHKFSEPEDTQFIEISIATFGKVPATLSDCLATHRHLCETISRQSFTPEQALVPLYHIMQQVVNCLSDDELTREMGELWVNIFEQWDERQLEVGLTYLRDEQLWSEIVELRRIIQCWIGGCLLESQPKRIIWVRDGLNYLLGPESVPDMQHRYVPLTVAHLFKPLVKYISEKESLFEEDTNTLICLIMTDRIAESDLTWLATDYMAQCEQPTSFLQLHRACLLAATLPNQFNNQQLQIHDSFIAGIIHLIETQKTISLADWHLTLDLIVDSLSKLANGHNERELSSRIATILNLFAGMLARSNRPQKMYLLLERLVSLYELIGLNLSMRVLNTLYQETCEMPEFNPSIQSRLFGYFCWYNNRAPQLAIQFNTAQEQEEAEQVNELRALDNKELEEHTVQSAAVCIAFAETLLLQMRLVDQPPQTRTNAIRARQLGRLAAKYDARLKWLEKQSPISKTLKEKSSHPLPVIYSLRCLVGKLYTYALHPDLPEEEIKTTIELAKYRFEQMVTLNPLIECYDAGLNQHYPNFHAALLEGFMLLDSGSMCLLSGDPFLDLVIDKETISHSNVLGDKGETYQKSLLRTLLKRRIEAFEEVPQTLVDCVATHRHLCQAVLRGFIKPEEACDPLHKLMLVVTAQLYALPELTEDDASDWTDLLEHWVQEELDHDIVQGPNDRQWFEIIQMRRIIGSWLGVSLLKVQPTCIAWIRDGVDCVRSSDCPINQRTHYLQPTISRCFRSLVSHIDNDAELFERDTHLLTELIIAGEVGADNLNWLITDYPTWCQPPTCFEQLQRMCSLIDALPNSLKDQLELVHDSLREGFSYLAERIDLSSQQPVHNAIPMEWESTLNQLIESMSKLGVGKSILDSSSRLATLLNFHGGLLLRSGRHQDLNLILERLVRFSSILCVEHSMELLNTFYQQTCQTGEANDAITQRLFGYSCWYNSRVREGLQISFTTKTEVEESAQVQELLSREGDKPAERSCDSVRICSAVAEGLLLQLRIVDRWSSQRTDAGRARQLGELAATYDAKLTWLENQEPISNALEEQQGSLFQVIYSLRCLVGTLYAQAVHPDLLAPENQEKMRLAYTRFLQMAGILAPKLCDVSSLNQHYASFHNQLIDAIAQLDDASISALDKDGLFEYILDSTTVIHSDLVAGCLKPYEKRLLDLLQSLIKRDPTVTGSILEQIWEALKAHLDPPPTQELEEWLKKQRQKKIS